MVGIVVEQDELLHTSVDGQVQDVRPRGVSPAAAALQLLWRVLGIVDEQVGVRKKADEPLQSVGGGPTAGLPPQGQFVVGGIDHPFALVAQAVDQGPARVKGGESLELDPTQLNRPLVDLLEGEMGPELLEAHGEVDRGHLAAQGLDQASGGLGWADEGERVPCRIKKKKKGQSLDVIPVKMRE